MALGDETSEIRAKELCVADRVHVRRDERRLGRRKPTTKIIAARSTKILVVYSMKKCTASPSFDTGEDKA